MASDDAEDVRLLETLSEGLRCIFHEHAVGAYLHGSTGLGRPGPQSDLDVLLVNATPMSDGARTSLTELVLAVSGHYPRPPGAPRPLELTVVTQADVRPWRYPPVCEFLYGEWLRQGVESEELPRPFACPDLAIVIRMVLTCDRPLFGPRASDVFDPVPSRDLVRATAAGLPDLVDDLENDTTNVLLTLARAWRTCAVGDIVSKDAAARWAGEQLAPDLRGLLEHASAVYRGNAAAAWHNQMPLVRSVAERMLERIHGLSGDL